MILTFRSFLSDSLSHFHAQVLNCWYYVLSVGMSNNSHSVPVASGIVAEKNQMTVLPCGHAGSSAQHGSKVHSSHSSSCCKNTNKEDTWGQCVSLEDVITFSSMELLCFTVPNAMDLFSSLVLKESSLELENQPNHLTIIQYSCSKWSSASACCCHFDCVESESCLCLNTCACVF